MSPIAGLVRVACFSLALLSAGTLALSQQIRYERLHRKEIERRLGSVPDRNRDCYAAIERMLRAAGCDDENLATQKVSGAREPNVVCTLPGELESTILVGAHFDASSRGDGVVDNWTGSILLPSLYQSVNKTPRRHTFIFIGFSGEENGLRGSRQYLGKLSKEERDRIRAMVNLDSLGLGPTKIWLSQSDPALVSHLAAVGASLDLPVAAVNVDQAGRGDHEPFWKIGIPCLVIHSITRETYGTLHTRDDNLQAIRMDDYYDTYVLLAAYLAYLDVKLE